MIAEVEGYIEVEGGRVWYQIVGSAEAIPLLTVHGGPGLPHGEIRPLEILAGERPVVFYDQLGCGLSDRTEEPTLWRVDRFVEELSQVREAIRLERVHILGHSWGSIIAAEYALTQPSGLVSLILSSPALSIPRQLESVAKYRSDLPLEAQKTLEKHEAEGIFNSEEYRAATMLLNKQHLCRLDTWPEAMSIEPSSVGWPALTTMWGPPTSFYVTGTLKDYDCTHRLHEITVPTLLICGRYDFASPENVTWYHSQMPNAKSEIIENSSHTPYLEEPDRYFAAVRSFLHRADG